MNVYKMLIFIAIHSTAAFLCASDSQPHSETPSTHSSIKSLPYESETPPQHSPTPSPRSSSPTHHSVTEKNSLISATGVVILDANSQPKAILDLTKPREHSIDKPALLMAEMAHNHLSAALTDSSNGVFRKRSKSMDKELQNILLLMSASGCDADTDEKDESSEVVDV